jgi:hypothetical protein
MERLTKIIRRIRKKETATAIPPLEKATMPKVEKRITRGDN